MSAARPKPAAAGRRSSCRRTRAPLGPSPKAIAAYQAEAAQLHRYPDGDCSALRQKIAQRHNLDAERIVCGAGSDELIRLLIRAYAGPGDEVLYSAHGFLMYKLAALAVGAHPVAAPERGLKADVDALLGRGHQPDPARLHRQPEQPDRQLSVGRRAGAAARPACPPTCCWSSMRPMPSSCRRADYSSGQELALRTTTS